MNVKKEPYNELQKQQKPPPPESYATAHAAGRLHIDKQTANAPAADPRARDTS
jgi:hypothetical protein